MRKKASSLRASAASGGTRLCACWRTLRSALLPLILSFDIVNVTRGTLGVLAVLPFFLIFSLNLVILRPGLVYGPYVEYGISEF